MKAAVLALAVCALMLAPLPALAQDAGDDPAAQAQEVDLPREARILVQRGLTFLGFDPGPADGLFGPRTRAAIWDWQAAKELNTTGYLTMSEAEALAAVGAEASEAMEIEIEAPAAQEPGGTEAEIAPAPSGSRNEVIHFPECGMSDAPDGCWRELSSPAKCHIWVMYYIASATDDDRAPFARGETVTWSGGCQHNAAHGRGTLTTKDDSYTGELVEGKGCTS